MTTAELRMVETSATCVKYELVADGQVTWLCRVAPDDAGHALARERMAAWALTHDVTIVDRAARLQLLKDLRERTRLLAGKDVRQISRAEVASLSLAQLEQAIEQAKADLEQEQMAVAEESKRGSQRRRVGRH